MKYKYYLSDFSLLIEIKAKYINEASQEVNITSSVPFEFQFWTDKIKSCKYVCSSDGMGGTKNCTIIDNSHIMVFFDQKVQPIGVGHLFMECHYYIHNAHYDDGIMDIKRFYNTEIVLTNQPELETEKSSEISIDLIPIILYGENTPVETSVEFTNASDILRKTGRIHVRNGLKYPSVTTENNVFCDDGRTINEHIKDIHDQLNYYICSSGANETTKVVASNLLEKGHSIGISQKIKMVHATNVPCKYKIGSGPEHTLFFNGQPASASNTWAAGDVLEIWCDGSFAYAKKWLELNGKGMSEEAIALLEKVLRNAIYEDGESKDIEDLINALDKGGSGSADNGNVGFDITYEYLIQLLGYTPAKESDVAALENLVNSLIVSNAKVTITASPSVIHKNEQTSISLNTSCSGVTPSSLVILEDSETGSQIASATNQSIISASKNVSVNGNTKTFVAVASIKEHTVTNSVSISARYPIYAGFGTSAESIITQTNKLTPRTSASGSYNGTSNANELNYFILVPSDISLPSTFVMGGAPFSMEKQATIITMSNINYTVFKSGEKYNSGTTLKIQVS